MTYRKFLKKLDKFYGRGNFRVKYYMQATTFSFHVYKEDEAFLGKSSYDSETYSWHFMPKTRDKIIADIEKALQMLEEGAIIEAIHAELKETKNPGLEYRMYGIVPYNMSPIQQGIQFGHAVVEYALKHSQDPEYQEWAKNHKTFIILNGGTTNNGQEPHALVQRDEPYTGTMQIHDLELGSNEIKLARFFEPDLNDTLTAVVFLVDERVFDKKEYPDLLDREPSKKDYDKWVKSIGGKKNAFLREFLSKFKLA
jgi:hypothetical protein